MARNTLPGSLSDDLLPPGLTFSPGEDVRSAPQPVPELDDSKLPPGLTFRPSAAPAPGLTMSAGPPARLPEGLTLEKPKPEPMPGPVTQDDVPAPTGWYNNMTSAFGRGMAQEAADLATGTRMLLPEGVGGLTADQQYQKGLVTPEHKDYTDTLLGQGLSEGWTNPNWWIAQLAHNVGGVVPGLGVAGAASLTPAGPLGGIAGFAGEAAIANLPRAYNAARARGLDDTQAIHQAILESGIAASFAGAMGMAGKFNVTKAISPYVAENVAKVLERPVSEAMVQLGLVQPGLMAAQDVAEGAARGQMPTTDQLATDMAVGGLAGLAIHQVFKERGGGEQGPATPDVVAAAQAAQQARPAGFERLKAGAEPAAPVAVMGPQDETPDDGRFYERDLAPKTRTDGRAPFAGTEPDAFYSQLLRATDQMPETMHASDVMNYFKKRGVKDAELEDAFLPSYLADLKTKQVKKSDLIGWIEANRVVIKEKARSDEEVDRQMAATGLNEKQIYLNDLYDNYTAQYGGYNSWPPRPKRHYNQVKAEVDLAAEQIRTGADPSWRNYALPGMREKPIEMTFAAPAKTYTPKEIEERAQNIWANETGNPWEHASEEEKGHFRDLGREDLERSDPNTFVGSHYSDPNVFAHLRAYFMKDRDGHDTMVLAEAQSDAHQEATKKLEDFSLAQATPEERAAHKPQRVGYKSEGGKIPDLPFKTNWQDLVAKRVLMLAANRGVTRLAWYNGDQVGMRLGDAKELKGARINYDEKMPSKFEKLARQFGEHLGETNFPDRPADPYEGMRPGPFLDDLKRLHQDMGLDLNKVKGPLRYMTISPKMAENLYHHGMAMYDVDPKVRKKGKTLSDIVQTNPEWRKFLPDFRKLEQTMNKVVQELGLTRGISFEVEQDPNAPYRGFMYKNEVDPVTRNYKVNVNLHRLMDRNEIYASMSHEVGHVVWMDKYRTAPDRVKAALKADFESKQPAWHDPARTVGDIRRERDNAISQMAGGRAMHDHYLLSDLEPGSKDYFLSFEEYFAEQFAKWMQTDERPLGVVEQFFKRLANVVRRVIVEFRKLRDGPRADPDAAIRDWLNKMWDHPKGWAEPFMQQNDTDTVLKAKDQFDREGAPETKAVPMQGSSAGGRDIIANMPPEARGNGEAMASHGDRMNLFYKWFTSLPQVQALNKHIPQLANYTSMHRMANVMKNTLMGDAYRRVRQWSKLNKDQMFGLTNFIQDYAHLDVRPDAKTFQDLVAKHGLSNDAVKVFQGITTDFDDFLNKYRGVLIRDAQAIKDPGQQADTIMNVNAKFDEMMKRPFMPITHFGKYSIQIIDENGNIVHYEQTNSLRRQRQIAEELEKRKNFPSDQVLKGMVPKDVTPFLGMPPGMIQLVGDKLSLSKTQRAALDQLRFDYAPAQTFKHQFRNLDLVPGYSTDFMRAYAHFFFHGANHLTRITFVDQMRDQIRSLGSQAERLARVGNSTGANKLDKIVSFMQNHFDAWVDPKSDWGALRGLMFHVYLGMNPASAAVNLTQTALSTYPWLASKYGDLATVRALTKASVDRNNFFKQQKLLDNGLNAPSGPEGARQRALAAAVEYGTLSESQAHQLAALSEDRNLLRPFGNKAEAVWRKFADVSSWMFDTSEKYNRHVAFNAAWDLANRAGTDHAAVKEAIARDPVLYQHLIDSEANGGKGWSKQEASMFLAAKHAVEATQFEFAPFARPKIMTGKLGGSLFIFKQFTQNMLFNLASNPGMLARWLVIMGAMGGIGGLAGYENVNSVIKTIAGRVFGKDFDLDDEVRHFAHDILNDVYPSDMLLHGTAVRGFGIPHVMHSMGANWFPTVDMSRSMGMGDILGFDPMKLTGLAPSLHPKEEELRQVGRASGAAFGMLPSLFDFASSNENFGQLKKWEPIIPHWAGGLSHAYRWYSEGRETNAAGNTTIRFDPADTQNMAEILARAAGFQPRRLTEAWEKTQALKESSDFWDLRRQILIRQYADAIKTGDDESAERVAQAISKFNDQLPDEAVGKAITSKGLKASVRQRLGVAAKQEEGIPVEKSNIPLQQAMEPYFPRGWEPDQVGAKPVQ